MLLPVQRFGDLAKVAPSGRRNMPSRRPSLVLGATSAGCVQILALRLLDFEMVFFGFVILGSGLRHRLTAGHACTLRLPIFSSQLATHGIAKFAPARYFHGFEAVTLHCAKRRVSSSSTTMRSAWQRTSTIRPAARASTL